MTEKRIMEYYIYENWRHKKAVIHLAECVCCNQGKGFHAGSTDINGQWLGPFKSKQEAELAAKKTKRKTISCCSRCI